MLFPLVEHMMNSLGKNLDKLFREKAENNTPFYQKKNKRE
jgi:hypothetical protein